MDLSSFSAIDSIDVTIYHPAFEDGKEPIFTLAGPCHEATRKAEKARAETLVKSRGRFDGERLALEVLSARILAWKNVTFHGEPLECNEENAFMLLSKPGLRFMRDQIYIAIGDNEAFFKA